MASTEDCGLNVLMYSKALDEIGAKLPHRQSLAGSEQESEMERFYYSTHAGEISRKIRAFEICFDVFRNSNPPDYHLLLRVYRAPKRSSHSLRGLPEPFGNLKSFFIRHAHGLLGALNGERS